MSWRWLSASLLLSGVCLAQSPLPLLHSPRRIDQVWGAYLAARDPRLHDNLVEALRQAERLREARRDTEDWVYVEALLDALIQQDRPVAEDALLPFTANWRDPVLILLARAPGDEDLLFKLRQEPQNLAQWLAVNNLLFRMNSPLFFRVTLQELRPTHLFEVRDVEWPVGRCGGAVGMGEETRKFPPGFPPVALYQLDMEQLTPLRDVAIAVEGPKNVYYRRVVVPTGQSAPWTTLAFFDNGESMREQYLAAFAHVTQPDVERRLHPQTAITWQSSDQVAKEIEDRLASQASAIRDFVVGAQRAGLGDVSGMRLKIYPHIDDLRKHSHDPLAGVAAKEIDLQ